MQLDFFTITENATLKEALHQIELNHHGMIFITNENLAVVALATDGDIRRFLINGGSLNDSIKLCSNSNFVYELSETSRELLLKKLDHRIRIIPLLDEEKRLTGIASRDHLPCTKESPVYARARAPVRISFGGGGSDLTHYFSGHDIGAVINTTISLYSHATLKIRNDEKIFIYSHDLQDSLKAENLHNAVSDKGKFGLIQALLRAINPDFGFELYLHSDFPMNSGLGGSSVVCAAVLGCFNQFRRDQWNSHELAEIAYQAERHYLGIDGGWQDQYAAVFGGFNFMEFRMEQNIVHPLRIHKETLLELEESLILCDTGETHDSGIIHQDQRNKMSTSLIRDLVKSNVALSYEMRNNLLRGKLIQFGELLNSAWHFKRQFSEKISSPKLEKIYDEAIHNGAIGGKLLGAGGGGFFLFYVPPFKKHKLLSHFNQCSLKTRPFRFEPNGMQSWKVRESGNCSEAVLS